MEKDVQRKQDPLESADLPEGFGFGEPSTAYREETWEQADEKPWHKGLHLFGMRQNQINRGAAARIRTLEVENRTLKMQLEVMEEKLEACEAREKKNLGVLAAELDRMHAELSRLRLSTKLNSNAIDRMIKGEETDTEKTETPPALPSEEEKPA